MSYLKIAVCLVFIVVLSILLLSPVNAQIPGVTIPSATEQHVIYFDDFEHGVKNWSLDTGWYLLNEGNNTYLKGNHYNNAKAWFLGGGWDNYTVKAKFRLIEGSFCFVYRMQDRGDCYWIIIDRNKVILEREISYPTHNNGIYRWELGNSTLALDDSWHDFKVTGYGNVINITIDDQQKIFYVDNDRPNLDGYFTIDMRDSPDVSIDDVEILGWPDTRSAYTVPYWLYLIDVSWLYMLDPNPPGMGLIVIPAILISFVIVIGTIIYLLKRYAFRRNTEQTTARPPNKPGPNGNVQKEQSYKYSKTIMPDAGDKPEEVSKKITRHDVFISYSHEDKQVADAVCNHLESHDIRCWISPRDVRPGANFQEAIIDAIASSRIMVLIFTAHSNNSQHVIRELTNAISKNVIIIPFKVEDVPLSKSMEYLISVPHWLDAMTPPLEKHIEELARTVQSILKE
jgi:hypothetical protein